MKKVSYAALRIGLGVTFLWIGVLIFRNPVEWSFYVQPWAAKLIPGTLAHAMTATALLDMLVGVLLLLDTFVWLAALLGALQLVVVMGTTAVSEITARDAGLLLAAFALMIETLPAKFAARFSAR